MLFIVQGDKLIYYQLFNDTSHFVNTNIHNIFTTPHLLKKFLKRLGKGTITNSSSFDYYGQGGGGGRAN